MCTRSRRLLLLLSLSARHHHATMGHFLSIYKGRVKNDGRGEEGVKRGDGRAKIELQSGGDT